MLMPRKLNQIPEEIARVARAVFPKGNMYTDLRDKLGSIYEDEQFTTLFVWLYFIISVHIVLGQR